MPEEAAVHPRLLAARSALRESGFRACYEASSSHPLGLLRLEVWAGENELWLLRSLEVGKALALGLFTLIPEPEWEDAQPWQRALARDMAKIRRRIVRSICDDSTPTS